jgi:hypothetical protein
MHLVVSARIQHALSEMNDGFGSARVRFRLWYERTPRRHPLRLRGHRRQPTPQRVRRRYILTLTCDCLVVHGTRPRVHGADGPDARAFRSLGSDGVSRVQSEHEQAAAHYQADDSTYTFSMA